MNVGHRESRLFPQLAPRRVVGSLIDVHKPAGKGPLAFARLILPFYEQHHGSFALLVGEHHAVGSHGWKRITL